MQYSQLLYVRIPKNSQLVDDDHIHMQMPGIAGYDDSCANLPSDDMCQWQQEWLGSGNFSTLTQQVDYKVIECPDTLAYWAFCKRKDIAAPSFISNELFDLPMNRTDSVHLGKGHKIAMGVSAIPLLISLVAVTIYFVKRRASPPKYNRESLSATKMPGDQIRWEKPELPGTYNCETLSTTKMPGEQIRWEKPELPGTYNCETLSTMKMPGEQIRWEKPELPETCLVELAGGSIRELDNECIHEAGSRHSRISATWREVLASIWSLRRITQHSPTSPRAPNDSVTDV
ncbi:MAG: hypothetical protein LQ337_008731 [Flavoplaca oasis]|nr:MAG: hypothetical protein LQ337_008731 [Flavoplaca oasis]